MIIETVLYVIPFLNDRLSLTKNAFNRNSRASCTLALV